MSAPTLAVSRTVASSAVEELGWRYLLGRLLASAPVSSLAAAARTAAVAVEACGADVDGHLRADLRRDRVELSLQTLTIGQVTALDLSLARAITSALSSAGTSLAPPTGVRRPVQLLELAIDALDIAAVRPFWVAVLGHADDPAESGPEAALIDPVGQLPSVWFQQMDATRPERNRIHLDLTVAHDEAPARVRAALAAGGRLLDDSAARSVWVLADPEGNEVCVCTWQDRDEPEQTD